MVTKIIIVVMVLAMIGMLGRGLYFMMTDRGKTDRTLNALKWRVGIWVVLLVFILAGMKLGFINPSNSIAPKTPTTTNQ